MLLQSFIWKMHLRVHYGGKDKIHIAITTYITCANPIYNSTYLLSYIVYLNISPLLIIICFIIWQSILQSKENVSIFQHFNSNACWTRKRPGLAEGSMDTWPAPATMHINKHEAKSLLIETRSKWRPNLNALSHLPDKTSQV